jgi:hypothetical protein
VVHFYAFVLSICSLSQYKSFILLLLRAINATRLEHFEWSSKFPHSSLYKKFPDRVIYNTNPVSSLEQYLFIFMKFLFVWLFYLQPDINNSDFRY